jgi:L-serine dehydratase
LERVARVQVELYGSLAATGRGHGTDKAVICGLEGHWPNQIDPDSIPPLLERVRAGKRVRLGGTREIAFDEKTDLLWNKRQKLPYHVNGMRYSAFDAAGELIVTRDYYSVGGGFVVNADEAAADRIVADTTPLPYPFHSGDELMALCDERGLSIAQLMLENEKVWRSEADIRAGLLTIWQAMQDCVARGLRSPGELPGGLHVKRRAPAMIAELRERPEAALKDPLTVLDWVNLYALAVNEENAAGGRVVTAPTNGAAGVVPAVMRYWRRFHVDADPHGTRDFLLTAAAIGGIIKHNASISGAEVGCQGEVGSASAMAAAGLCAVMGGTPEQVENAAEIALEHHLGMTCDPVGGLVQVPCIERNALGAVKAVTAASLAIKGDGQHFVPLDAAVETMRQTGHDMNERYKETSQGGLAVNVVEC